MRCFWKTSSIGCKNIDEIWGGLPQQYRKIGQFSNMQDGIQKFQDFIKKQKKVFFCKHFIGRLGNSPLRTEYNDLHDQEDYRITFLGHPSVWR